MSPVLPVSPNSLYVKHIQSAIMACNNAAGLHIRDADRLKTAIYKALDEALNTPATSSGRGMNTPVSEAMPPAEPAAAAAKPGLGWEIVDNNAALWTITVTDLATERTTTHYLVAEGDALTLQDLLDIYHDDRYLLAEAFDMSHVRRGDMLLAGAVNLGFVRTIR